MVRTGIGVVTVVAAALFSGTFIQAARAQSGMPVGAGDRRSGDGGSAYGGGFIELLMSGQDPARAARPYRAAPVRADGSLVARPLASADVVPPAPSLAPAYDYNAPWARVESLPAANPEEVLIARAPDPRFGRQEVLYDGAERPGTIVIDTPQKFLFLVQPGGRALRYGIGVGRPGFSWAGVKTVSRKAEWPDWTPPPEMLRRRPDLPAHMAGGPANPLGARALYLGSSLYRIHGTNEPHTIGQSVSSGCIRMMNDDVVDLYGRVPVGARVIVM